MGDVVIVGGGIAGLATAVALKRVGIPALVLEKSDGLRTGGAALSLSQNAWLALDTLGVSHKLNSFYAPVLGAIKTDVSTGAVTEILIPENEAGPRAVHRRALLEALAQELPADGIRFSSNITSIETDEHGGVVLCFDDGTTIKPKVLIGCDGVHSVVAKWLGLSAPIDSGRSGVRGLAVYAQGHGIKQKIHIFLGVGKRAGVTPLNDKELALTLIWRRREGEHMPRDPKIIQKEIIETFGSFPAKFLDMVGHADLSSLTWAPLIFRNPLNVIFGNLSKGNVTVAGDAMHPMTPDIGQGACSALEDAVVLGRHIGNSFVKNGRLVPENIARALDGYVKERRWRVAALIIGSNLLGWIQQGGSNWWMKLLRDVIFYGALFRNMFRTIFYDCGQLPSANEEINSYGKTD